jgi:hypothetical protein
LQIKTKIVSCHTDDTKPVKQEQVGGTNRNKLEEQTGTSCRNKEEGLFAWIAMADVEKFCNVVTGMITIVAGAVAKAEVFIIGVAAERNNGIFDILLS